MIYVPNDYLDYKYVVAVSDNYIVLTDTRSVSASWDSPREIDVIYQFFTPSITTIESTRIVTTNTTYEPTNVSDSFYARADCNSIIQSEFYVLFFFLFLFNGLTRWVKKGGVIFGQ